MKQKEKPPAKPRAQATVCKDGLRYNRGCSTLGGQHNHGAWRPREKCNDPDCAKRTQGWKLAEINAAKRLALEKAAGEVVSVKEQAT